MRCTDPKLVDRLEQNLRLLQTKFNKKPKSESIIQTIGEVSQEIKSEAFIQALELFQDEDEPKIIEQEIEISNTENEEQKVSGVTTGQMKPKKKEPVKILGTSKGVDA